MFITGPPGSVSLTGTASVAGSADAAGPVLRIRRSGRRAFAGSAAEAEPGLRVFLADLVRPYQLKLREDLLAAGPPPSYGEMAGPLIGSVVPATAPVDLLMLAFTVPDGRPERATASHLSHLCPGQPMAFALCDQGPAAAFTGLRLAAEYLRDGVCQRALLLVTEQATLPYDPPAPAVLPERHAAVALLCEADQAADGQPANGSAPGGGPALVGTREHTGVAPGEAAELLADALARAAAGTVGPPVVILGRELARLVRESGTGGLPPSGEVRVAPPGQPGTGVWWELAGEMTRWPAGRRVILANYDPALRYLCLAGFGELG